MELRQRRVVSRFLRVALVALAVGLAILWLQRRAPAGGDVDIQVEAPPIETLGPGDVQIFNEDTTVDLVLRGDRIYAGLSPKIVAKVRTEMAKEKDRDTTGLGGAIAHMVKQQVAEKIGTRVVYDVGTIRDLRYDDPNIVIEWKRGGEQRLFESVKVDGNRSANRFRREDAERFIAAVKTRQRN